MIAAFFRRYWSCWELLMWCCWWWVVALVLLVSSIGEGLSRLAVGANAVESVEKTARWATMFRFASLRQQLLDEQEFREDKSDDWDDQSLLGDQCNSEKSNDGECGELKLDQTEDWEEWLQDLLLLATGFWDQWADRWLDFLWDGVWDAACSRGHVKVQWAFLEEALGSLSDEVLQCIFTVLNAACWFNGDIVNVGRACITASLFDKRESTEDVDLWAFEDCASLTVDLYGENKYCLLRLVTLLRVFFTR